MTAAPVRRLVLLAVGWLVASQASSAMISVTITGADGMPLQDAAVYAVPVNGATDLRAPRKAEIDQRNKTFVPAVSVIQTGAAVSFPNSDNIRHQVYSFSPAKVFNIKLYSGRPAEPVVFDKPGIVVLGCNIHDRMAAWVVVVETPWFASTDARGTATLDGLPGGDYVLHYWHPGLQGEPLTRAVQLGPEAQHEETLQIDAAGLPQAGHGGHGGSISP